jgi:hypothetical protein
VQILQNHCETFGTPEELSTDGGSQFVAGGTQEFLRVWGIKHRLSSAYHPHSNTRAELGVKSMKRLLRSNVGPGGSLDTTKMGRALLEYRNTPDRDTGLSPAQVIFGRMLRDFIPVVRDHYKPRQEWLLDAERREQALARRHILKKESLTMGSKELRPLPLGQVVSVQNQTGVNKLKWDKSGTIVESLPNHQYKVKMDGTGRVSLRNRIYLRAILPYGAAGVPSHQLVTPVALGDVDQHRGPVALRDVMEAVQTPRDIEEDEVLERVPGTNLLPDQADADSRVPRRSSRVTRKPEVYTPGVWGTIGGRSSGPGEITGSQPKVWGSREWTPEGVSLDARTPPEKVIGPSRQGQRTRQLGRSKQLSLMKDFNVTSAQSRSLSEYGLCVIHKARTLASS